MSSVIPRRVWRPLRTFLATESAGGIVLLAAAFVALVWANTPWSQAYHDLWGTDLAFRLGTHGLTLDLRHWVNDGLMTIFFLVAGLEIKREIVQGELRDVRQAALPIVAAIGGMVVPAVLYLVVTWGGPTRGWAVPMPTDIAMVLGALALVRTRVHPILPLLMLALAIVDDIGSIVVVAIGLGGDFSLGWLGLGIAVVLVADVVRRQGIRATAVFVACGVVCWYCLYRSGVPPTLAGVAFGLMAPTTPLVGEIDQAELADLSSAPAARRSAQIAVHSVSTVERLEHLLHPWTSYAIMPLFALANAGVSLRGGRLADTAGSRVFWGVVVGRVIGKPLGVVAAVIVAERCGLVRLPEGVTRRDVLGLGALAGMGFAVAIFIGRRSLSGTEADAAVIGVIASLLVSGVFGLILLTRRPRSA
jgi:Na+:H+ antiporter, NhaA family